MDLEVAMVLEVDSEDQEAVVEVLKNLKDMITTTIAKVIKEDQEFAQVTNSRQ